MNRRLFLAGAIAAGAVVTAEGLWVPGAKLISIPKPGRYLGMDLGFWPSTTAVVMHDHWADAMRYGIGIVSMRRDEQHRLNCERRSLVDYFDDSRCHGGKPEFVTSLTPV